MSCTEVSASGTISTRQPRAEVAKRQTQWTQNPPCASTCGFKSRPRHQILSADSAHLLAKAALALKSPREDRVRPWLNFDHPVKKSLPKRLSEWSHSNGEA